MNNKYECKDLMLAAALLALDVPLVGLEPRDRYYNFVFDDYRRGKEIELMWWAGKLTVSATKYADSIKRLKSLIYSQK